MRKRKSKLSPLGTHWCGGLLVKEGHRAQRCLRCNRVKFLEGRN